MKLHEYQAKEIVSRYGIAIPRGKIASNPAEAKSATQELGGQAVLKAQVHAGGRGKAGGVKVVQSPEEAEQVSREMLGHNLVTNQTNAQGAPVNSVLVEELADIKRELYVARTIDRRFRGPVGIGRAKALDRLDEHVLIAIAGEDQMGFVRACGIHERREFGDPLMISLRSASGVDQNHIVIAKRLDGSNHVVGCGRDLERHADDVRVHAELIDRCDSVRV